MSLRKSVELFHELQFLKLSQQSNIYGMSSFNVDGDSPKVVVATLGRLGEKIFSVDVNKLRVPKLQSLDFSYIPAEAEIIAIDTFVKPPNSAVIGVALIKQDQNARQAFLNIYGVRVDSTASFSWTSIADDWQTLPLSFVPFQLTHTQVLISDQWETVFLLSGDDMKVHVFRLVENSEAESTIYEEPCHSWFPELVDIPSSVTFMDFKQFGNQRLTVVACQSGYVRFSITDVTSLSNMKTWDLRSIDGPFTVARFFTLNTNTPGDQKYHLLVATALELAVVFWDVIKYQFKKPITLPESCHHDSIMCGLVADIDWDGVNEIVIGTYGKRLLVYKCTMTIEDIGHFELQWKRQFAYPLHSLSYEDITRDGVKEMVVLSTAGVHILQHDLQAARRKCLDSLQNNLPPYR
ncbi:KICSTOR complex protein kaptin-like [Dysidea avara]|uniref:KICSTOR complex protein kaptin-like n=1 Tax=Dysidea avara TaxID=196820 RepID=UPI0033244A24